MKKTKTYRYQNRWGHSEMVGNMVGVILHDGTEITFLSKKGLYVKYPRKKFGKIFEAQKKSNPKDKYFNILYSKIELRAIYEGFMKSLNELDTFEKGGKKNGRKSKR